MNRVRDLSARWIRDAAFMEFDIKIQILMWYLGDSTIQYCTVTISNAIFGKGSLLRNEPQSTVPFLPSGSAALADDLLATATLPGAHA